MSESHWFPFETVSELFPWCCLPLCWLISLEAAAFTYLVCSRNISFALWPVRQVCKVCSQARKSHEEFCGRVVTEVTWCKERRNWYDTRLCKMDHAALEIHLVCSTVYLLLVTHCNLEKCSEHVLWMNPRKTESRRWKAITRQILMELTCCQLEAKLSLKKKISSHASNLISQSTGNIKVKVMYGK